MFWVVVGAAKGSLSVHGLSSGSLLAETVCF